ncbi:MAG: 2-amino-4-hydroxy-6-hydroxymethyldihydropteridine diphosphokinase [Deltaproteobacteria bacterium]|nr:2-amino-4-hydroxy-6-hydroxymethyldihydropteridine diphosphokinase [Deltaproteobacteria bacterium]
MQRAYIGIGSNLGDKFQHCRAAVEKMENLTGSRVEALSEWYLTKPVGVQGQDWYVNGVAALSTILTPQALLDELLAIEADMGRVRKSKWEARIIDLDILLYGREVIDEDHLKIPHPLMHLRRFVLAPLAQLDPGMVHPVMGVSMVELLEKIPQESQAVYPAME